MSAIKFDAKYNRYSMFTPVGIVQPYAWLNKADEKYSPVRYKADVALDANDPKVKELIELIDRLADEAHEQLLEIFTENPPKAKRGQKAPTPEEAAEAGRKDLPYWFDEEDDSIVYIKASSNRDRKDGKTGKTKQVLLRIVDSRGKPMKEVPIINANSEIKIKLGIRSYAATGNGSGVTLDLDSVMLVKLAAWGGGDSEWGDEAVDGGFDGSEYTPPAGKPEDEKPMDSDNDGSEGTDASDEEYDEF